MNFLYLLYLKMNYFIIKQNKHSFIFIFKDNAYMSFEGKEIQGKVAISQHLEVRFSFIVLLNYGQFYIKLY